MKPIILAAVLSIIIHILLFFLPLDIFQSIEKKKKPPVKVEKQSKVRYVKLKPKIVPKKEIKEEVKKEIKRPQEYKKVEPKKIKPQTKVSKNKALKKIPKKIVKKEFKRAPKKDVVIKPQEKRKRVQDRSLENFFLSSPEPVNKEMLDKVTKSYIDLYGREYENFTNVQKVFIQNKLKSIVEITRSYYQFPAIAIKLKKNDYNAVEFFLYPNGDISDLKIIIPGEYDFYDDSIIEAIEYAYKDFPRPKTKTKIRFYIQYRTHY